MNRRSTLLALLALTTALAASAQQSLADLAADDAAARLSDVVDAAAARAAAARYRRHRVRFRATLSDGGLLRQAAVVTLSFEMEAAADIRGERSVRNLACAVELLAGGDLALPGYVLACAGPEPRPFAFSAETRDGVDFTIEAPTRVDARADGTVLEPVLGRDQAGRRYGQDVRLVMHPYCSRDLQSCRLGLVAGVADLIAFPTYRLRSDEVFSMAAEP
ncbi:MAG: hypothetical protein A2X36_15110 [Elusimicrobia bacterium GWA2_69_24]|nr:MAG: hypothetical protein A2X36_15110 [Elusimicrobia bacterium GWA2_69_24]HBL16495.1 hypothetical protein [Elusimicrobiota bacterium]